MAVMQRFQSQIKAAKLLLGPGGIVDSASGIAAKAHVAQRLSVTVTATTNTDFTMSVPPGASILGITSFTTTGFGAVTDAKLSVGTSAGDATYVAATSIKAAGVVVMTLAGAGQGAIPSGSPNLFLRIAQSGGNSATGAATIVVDYVTP